MIQFPKKSDKAKAMLPDEWACLFIHWLVKHRGYKKRHHEILNKQLIKEAARFAEKWSGTLGINIKHSEIIDACLNHRLIIPCATDHFEIREDLIKQVLV